VRSAPDVPVAKQLGGVDWLKTDSRSRGRPVESRTVAPCRTFASSRSTPLDWARTIGARRDVPRFIEEHEPVGIDLCRREALTRDHGDTDTRHRGGGGAISRRRPLPHAMPSISNWSNWQQSSARCRPSPVAPPKRPPARRQLRFCFAGLTVPVISILWPTCGINLESSASRR